MTERRLSGADYTVDVLPLTKSDMGLPVLRYRQLFT